MEADCVFKLFVDTFLSEFFCYLFCIKIKIIFKNSVAKGILAA